MSDIATVGALILGVLVFALVVRICLSELGMQIIAALLGLGFIGAVLRFLYEVGHHWWKGEWP